MENIYIITTGHHAVAPHIAKMLDALVELIKIERDNDFAELNKDLHPESRPFPIVNTLPPEEYYFKPPPTRRERRAAERRKNKWI